MSDFDVLENLKGLASGVTFSGMTREDAKKPEQIGGTDHFKAAEQRRASAEGRDPLAKSRYDRLAQEAKHASFVADQSFTKSMSQGSQAHADAAIAHRKAAKAASKLGESHAKEAAKHKEAQEFHENESEGLAHVDKAMSALSPSTRAAHEQRAAEKSAPGHSVPGDEDKDREPSNRERTEKKFEQKAAERYGQMVDRHLEAHRNGPEKDKPFEQSKHFGNYLKEAKSFDEVDEAKAKSMKAWEATNHAKALDADPQAHFKDKLHAHIDASAAHREAWSAASKLGNAEAARQHYAANTSHNSSVSPKAPSHEENGWAKWDEEHSKS